MFNDFYLLMEAFKECNVSIEITQVEKCHIEIIDKEDDSVIVKHASLTLLECVDGVMSKLKDEDYSLYSDIMECVADDIASCVDDFEDSNESEFEGEGFIGDDGEDLESEDINNF